MGRPWGSGRRTVEQTCSIEIGALKREGYLAGPKQGHWVWRWNGEIIGTARIEWDGGRLMIRNQVIALWKAGCRFGGQRLWFKCSCGRHVATIYSPNGGRGHVVIAISSRMLCGKQSRVTAICCGRSVSATVSAVVAT